jgi:2-methylcitrate dehydratase PrpD
MEWIGRKPRAAAWRQPAESAGCAAECQHGHALDFDDTLDTGGSIHPGVSGLGAVLAVSDSLGNVTGKELLLAVALGLDVSCRVALASTVDRGWHRTAAMGVFGAAAAAGKLLGLTRNRCWPHSVLPTARRPATGNASWTAR